MQIAQEIKQYGKENNVPIVMDDTLLFLLKTINENNSKKVLEIGTAIAYSTIEMAINTDVEHIDTVEIDEARYKIAVQNVKNKNLQNKITLHLQDAIDYVKNCKIKYDFIYLDGPKGQYINYLPYLTKLLNKNGIIFADNLFFHGMVTETYPVSKNCRSMIKGLKNYINEITTNPIYSTTIYEIGDGIGVTKLK